MRSLRDRGNRADVSAGFRNNLNQDLNPPPSPLGHIGHYTRSTLCSLCFPIVSVVYCSRLNCLSVSCIMWFAQLLSIPPLSPSTRFRLNFPRSISEHSSSLIFLSPYLRLHIYGRDTITSWITMQIFRLVANEGSMQRRTHSFGLERSYKGRCQSAVMEGADQIRLSLRWWMLLEAARESAYRVIPLLPNWSTRRRQVARQRSSGNGIGAGGVFTKYSSPWCAHLAFREHWHG
jgi:hypothetical protein